MKGTQWIMDAEGIVRESLKGAKDRFAADGSVSAAAETPGNGPSPEDSGDGGQQRGTGIKEEDVISSIRLFLKGAKWRKIYDGAPDGAKNRLALNFYWSACKDNPGFDRAAYLSLRTKLEESLTWEDIEYLISTTENDLARNHYRQLLSALNARNGGETVGTGPDREMVGGEP